MRIEYHTAKETANLIKHKLDFSFSERVLSDPLAVTVHDRCENGEDRWHAFAWVGGKLLLVVYTYPDPDDDDRIRVIGLRQATAFERKQYEEVGDRV